MKTHSINDYTEVLGTKPGNERATATEHLNRAKEAILNAQAALSISMLPLIEAPGANCLLTQIDKISEILKTRLIG